VTQVLELLPSKHKALSSNPRTTKDIVSNLILAHKFLTLLFQISGSISLKKLQLMLQNACVDFKKKETLAFIITSQCGSGSSPYSTTKQNTKLDHLLMSI
jgi:hypothetical protein